MNVENEPYRIVVGHDLAPTGDRAVEEAMALARRIPGSEIHVVYALARPSAKSADAGRHLDDALARLRAQVQPLFARDRSLVGHVHVRFGKIVETLIGVAVDRDASVILVGTHGTHGADRVRSRSVAERLVRQAPLPVLVAHAKDFGGLPMNVRPTHSPTSASAGADHTRTARVTEPA